MKHPISLAILTWKAPKTLQNTLQSLEPILDQFEERIIVCQESDPGEIELAERYGFKPIALKTNVGIQYGMKKAFEACSNEQVLFLENDLVLIPPKEEVVRIISAISDALAEGKAEFAKLRYLPASGRNSYKRFWKCTDGRPVRRLYGYLRYQLANLRASEVLLLGVAPGIKTEFLTDIGNGLYATTSEYSSWENRAFLAIRSFFLQEIIPYAESHPTSRTVNGMPDLEHRINSPANRNWWRKSKYKHLIAHPGLFGHRRLDRYVKDEKWQMGGPSHDDGPVEIVEDPQEKGM
jgi:hypothetical protein